MKEGSDMHDPNPNPAAERLRELLADKAAFGLDDAEGPLVSAAIDAAMMLARGRLVAAADALAIARGQSLRGWCETMRGVPHA